MIFKFIALCMIVVFSYATQVQFNDPDSTFWAVMYGLAVLTSVAAFADLPLKAGYWVVLGVYLAAVMWLSPNFAHTSWQAFTELTMNSIEIELVRELWGMVICTLWSMVLVIRYVRSNPVFTTEERHRAVDEAECI